MTSFDGLPVFHCPTISNGGVVYLKGLEFQRLGKRYNWQDERNDSEHFPVAKVAILVNQFVARRNAIKRLVEKNVARTKTITTLIFRGLGQL